MFDAIAPRYDLLNRLMSAGADQRWRRLTARALELRDGARVLDVATGTADLALAAARSAQRVFVHGVDPSPRMLELGRRKIVEAGLAERVALVVGEAERLPFANRSFDAVTIAFGIRNVPDRRRGLAEMARVLVPGGRAAVLELTSPKRGLLAPAVRFWVHRVTPLLGALLSRAPEYRYLERSIADFPAAPEFARLMADVGFSVRSVRPLSWGACHLFVGVKPEVAP